ncbi:hypothetical protein ACFL6M_01955 [Candidatus Eisenbacteria bacterium]|uniref:Uncharacterized protein n=1 Tax=Eiseniibacteriota bacterium TaxID=2212470 RepID=A0ABV6YJ42_UNCEI
MLRTILAAMLALASACLVSGCRSDEPRTIEESAAHTGPFDFEKHHHLLGYEGVERIVVDPNTERFILTRGAETDSLPRIWLQHLNPLNQDEDGDYVPNITLEHLVCPGLDNYMSEVPVECFNKDNVDFDQEQYDRLLARLYQQTDVQTFMIGPTYEANHAVLVSSSNVYGAVIDSTDIRLVAIDVLIPVNDLAGRSVDRAVIDYIQMQMKAAQHVAGQHNAEVWSNSSKKLVPKLEEDADAFIPSFHGIVDADDGCRQARSRVYLIQVGSRVDGSITRHR